MSNTNPIFQSGPSNGAPATIVNADGTVEKTIYTAGVNGALVDSVFVTSDDPSSVVLSVFVNDGATSYLIGAINVPALSGTNGMTAGINLLSLGDIPALQAGGGLALAPTYKLNVAAQSSVTATNTVTLVAAGGEY